MPELAKRELVGSECFGVEMRGSRPGLDEEGRDSLSASLVRRGVHPFESGPAPLPSVAWPEGHVMLQIHAAAGRDVPEPTLVVRQGTVSQPVRPRRGASAGSEAQLLGDA